jgi:hypothetical protein
MTGGDARLGYLRHHATRVRQAIEMTDLRNCGFNLSAFPDYCCHHAVMLLAFHLFETGETDLQAANGTRNNALQNQHVWLQSEDILVDITADQFGEDQSRVIATRHSPWHEAWKPTLKSISKPNVILWMAMANPISDAYCKIMVNLASMVRP